MIVLCGDIGVTSCRLALYRAGTLAFDRVYPSADAGSIEAVTERFLEEARKALGPENARPVRACYALPGPVENDTSRVTNLPWFVDARKVEQRTRIPRVQLINDFQAVALGVTVLGPEHLVQLGGAERKPKSPIVVCGAGTGLGEAFLFHSPADDRYHVVASEGGHVDFTPRTGLELGLFQYLSGRYGRVSFERVLSSQGLADIYGFLSSEPSVRGLITDETRGAMVREDAATVVSRQAMAGMDPVCTIALNLFCSVLGGLAGNLALTFLAAGGVYIAGGIAPRIVEWMKNGVFRDSFESKGRFQPLVAQVPVFVVMHKEVGMLGAVSLASHG